MQPITSIRSDSRANVGEPKPADASERAVAAEFEAILFQAVFTPVAKAMGFYGDAVVAEATRALAHAP